MLGYLIVAVLKAEIICYMEVEHTLSKLTALPLLMFTML